MKWKSVLLAVLVAAAATAQPLRVAAQAVDDETIEGFDEQKFWSYAGCAASIALGATTGAWVFTLLACGRAATAFWTE